MTHLDQQTLVVETTEKKSSLPPPSPGTPPPSQPILHTWQGTVQAQEELFLLREILTKILLCVVNLERNL